MAGLVWNGGHRASALGGGAVANGAAGAASVACSTSAGGKRGARCRAAASRHAVLRVWRV